VLELADIFRAAGPAYCQTHAGRMLPSHRRAMRDIVRCRTPDLGGSLYACDDCGTLEYRYHSCRNRHCPKCQEDRAQHWLERLRERLLPCDHYLITFTLPSELRPVARSHQRQVYSLLLREAAASVQTLAHNRSWIGATPAILAVLHTWSRTLSSHPHVHLLVTAGGLSTDRTAWIKPAHPRFLLPGYVLSEIFRANIHHALARAGLDQNTDPKHLDAPLGPPRPTNRPRRSRCTLPLPLRLPRRSHQPAPRTLRHGRVTFRYTHARTREIRHLTLPVHAFIARFLQRVLPRGFAKIRSYGLMSPSRRNDLERARRLLQLHSVQHPGPSTRTGGPPAPGNFPRAADDRESDASDATPGSVTATTTMHPSVPRCPVCHGTSMCLVQRYRPSRAPPW